jgi:integrase/recombinase XerD
MEQLLKKGLSLAECVADYDLYAQEVRGLAASTREMHRRLLRRFCIFRFGEEPVLWDAVCFTDIVRFLTAEFERFPNRGTQRASLTSMRTLLRYLAEKSMVPKGSDEALPRTTTRRHAHLPRQVSREQVSALFRASQGNKWIAPIWCETQIGTSSLKKAGTIPAVESACMSVVLPIKWQLVTIQVQTVSFQT